MGRPGDKERSVTLEAWLYVGAAVYLVLAAYIDGLRSDNRRLRREMEYWKERANHPR